MPPGTRATPGAPVTVIAGPAAFYADADGFIWSTYLDPQTGGGGHWLGVSEGRSTAGARVAALLWQHSYHLFVADRNGGIYTAAGYPEWDHSTGLARFGPWSSVSEGSSTAGGPVTAVPWGNQIAVFLADPNGGIYTTSSRFDPPARPKDLRVTEVTAHTIGISWIHDTDDQNGFRVRFSGKRTGAPDYTGEMSLGPDARTASLTDLLSGYDRTITLLAFNAAGDSANVAAEAKTLTVPETVTISLKRETVISGFVPYDGIFRTRQGGHLLEIAVPLSSEVLVIHFVKVGHSTEECGDPNAVVSIAEGTATSPEQLTAIYGVSKPAFSREGIGFVACVGQANPNTLVDFVNINLTIILDGP
jgi:hypothetical protein